MQFRDPAYITFLIYVIDFKINFFFRNVTLSDTIFSTGLIAFIYIVIKRRGINIIQT